MNNDNIDGNPLAGASGLDNGSSANPELGGQPLNNSSNIMEAVPALPGNAAEAAPVALEQAVSPVNNAAQLAAPPTGQPGIGQNGSQAAPLALDAVSAAAAHATAVPFFTTSNASARVAFDWKQWGNPNPFDHAASSGGNAQSGGESQTAFVLVPSTPSRPPSSASQGSTAGGAFGSASINVNFSNFSAEQLVDKLRQKIPALDREAWVQLGLDAASILELSNPSVIAGQLTEYLGLVGLLRDRVANAIKLMIIGDETVDVSVREMWGARPSLPSSRINPLSGTSENPIHVTSTTPVNNSIVNVSDGSAAAQTPQQIRGQFTTPINHTSPLTPNFLLFDGAGYGEVRHRSDDQLPSFLSEVSGRTQFSLDHASQAPSVSNTTTLVPHAGGSTTASAAGGMQNISITLHQPNQQQYNWVILENLDVRTTFMTWLKKNRRERVICDPAHLRSLASLCTVEVRDEICRTYMSYPHLFGDGSTIKSYADMSEDVLMRILFYRFGPRNALDAKQRLSEVKFRFDDSSTLQDRFGPKHRRFCSEWRQSLLDFKYTCKLWPPAEDLTHQSIVDSFLSCFEIEPDIVGPDPRTKVPKSSGMPAVRAMIREHKHQKIDAIIDIITKRFDQIDATIRADPLLKYAIQPWRITGTFNARKRKWNQMANGHESSAKQHDSPHPRCANCGSKGHKCGERTCYFWGHPKAKGPKGEWPIGTPSLRLADDEMKEWRVVRHDVFYSYDENKNKKTPPKNNSNKGGGKFNRGGGIAKSSANRK